MSNIKKIFVRDILALLKNPLAAIIAGGLCVIPALYAWFNIYSNWDPYGNTGDIPIAVATEDTGYTDEDGEYTNVSKEVIEELKENKAIKWTVKKSGKEAKQSVEAGECYAAVVFSKDFTRCMFEGYLEELKRPTVTYYENEKKNAVAVKITDTAVSNLQNNMNQHYISLVVSRLFDKQEQLVDEMDEKDVKGSLLKRIDRVDGVLKDFTVTVQSLEQANAKLSASMEGAQGDLSAVQSNLDALDAKVQQVPDTAALADSLNQKSGDAMQNMSDAISAIGSAAREDTAEKKLESYQTAVEELGYAKGNIDTLVDSLQTINLNTVNSSQKIVITQLENLSATIGRMMKRMNKGISQGDVDILEQTAETWNEQMLMAQESMQSSVSQSLAVLGAALQSASDQISTVIGNVSADIDIIDTVLGNGVTAVDLTNKSFTGIETELNQVSGKLEEVKELLTRLDESELSENFTTFMQGDPEGYGAFFSEPVTIETQAIYPVENYGSGVAPFYTTLAIWVGGVVLVSLIKVRTHTDDLVRPKDFELFFGRYLLFLLLSIIQTVIIVWGNLYLLGIQCLHPSRFLFAALVAGVTFSLLIYSFTVSFGDIGKAIIVVIMVLQVAGSSGTYPIEILPEFYQRVYIFFPFPYAIDAMREAICGMYEKDYTLYLIRLGLFAVAALALGLIIRKPFMGINHFVEKRMEDTEMM